MNYKQYSSIQIIEQEIAKAKSSCRFTIRKFQSGFDSYMKTISKKKLTPIDKKLLEKRKMENQFRDERIYKQVYELIEAERIVEGQFEN